MDTFSCDKTLGFRSAVRHAIPRAASPCAGGWDLSTHAQPPPVTGNEESPQAITLHRTRASPFSGLAHAAVPARRSTTPHARPLGSRAARRWPRTSCRSTLQPRQPLRPVPSRLRRRRLALGLLGHGPCAGRLEPHAARTCRRPQPRPVVRLRGLCSAASADAVSLWVSWFTGCTQVDSNLALLDPAAVRIHVRLCGLRPAKRYCTTSSLAISSPFLLCMDFLFPSSISWIHSTKVFLFFVSCYISCTALALGDYHLR